MLQGDRRLVVNVSSVARGCQLDYCTGTCGTTRTMEEALAAANRSRIPQSRVFGGRRSAYSAWPWQVETYPRTAFVINNLIAARCRFRLPFRATSIAEQR